MTFTVTYRGADGAMREERVEAAGRGECFAQCRARGIAPLSVKEGDSVSRRERRGRREGWGKNGRAAASAKAMAAGGRVSRAERAGGRVVACVLSVAFVALIGGGVWWWVDRHVKDMEPYNQGKKSGLVKEVRAAVPDLPEPMSETNKDVTVPPPKVRHVKHPVTGADMVVTQKIVKLLPNASRIGTVYTNNVFKPPKKLYKTFSENYVVGLMRVQNGMPIVGGRLPRNFDEEFKAHLNDPIEILPDDTEEDIRIKERMVDVKKEMAKLIAEGASPSELVLNERREMNRLAQMRKNYMKDLAEYRKGGATRQQIEDYVTAANKVLDEYGIKHIKLPLEPIKKLQVTNEE